MRLLLCFLNLDIHIQRHADIDNVGVPTGVIDDDDVRPIGTDDQVGGDNKLPQDSLAQAVAHRQQPVAMETGSKTWNAGLLADMPMHIPHHTVVTRDVLVCSQHTTRTDDMVHSLNLLATYPTMGSAGREYLENSMIIIAGTEDLILSSQEKPLRAGTQRR